MLLFSLRNLLARKGRLLLSAFAIVLGVAFLSGSLIFTDTIGKGFDNIVSGSLSDASVRLTGLDTDTMGGGNADERLVPAAVVATLAGAPRVARADGSVEGQGLFVVKSNGKLLGGTGAPTIALNYTDAPNTAGDPSVSIASGRPPEKTGEVALDRRSADLAGYTLGDTVAMVTAGSTPTLSALLVGYADFAGGGLAGATLVLFDTTTAQDLFLAGQDGFSSVGLTAAPGVSEEQLVRSVTPLLPADLEAVTGTQLADEIRTVVDTVLGFLNAFLLIFAGIALVVGSFLIINTFAILVAQRSRELALIRALGASRPQVLRSVLTEAAVVGLVGATLGLLLGVGLAALLRTVFATFGLDLTGTSLVFSARTVLASYLVGILVTMFAAYLPARRAARVPPVAAMREDPSSTEGSLRGRLIAGGGLAVVGVVLMATGLLGDGTDAAVLAGAGVFAILMAVAALSPALAVPVLTAVGWIYSRTFGEVGRLATQNSLRNLRRTAATASALMIGLALVTTISILGSSVSSSIDVAIDDQFTSDFLVSNAIGQSFSPTIAEDLAAVEGVGDIAATQRTSFTVDGSSVTATATDAAALDRVLPIHFVSGSAASTDGQIALSEDTARSLDARPGDVLVLRFAAGDVPSTVTGVYTTTYLVAGAIVPFSTVAAGQVQRADSTVFIDAAPDVDKRQLGERLDAATLDVPTVTVQNKDDYSASQRGQIDQLLYLIYALLGLAIIIAVLGIVNTLALSIIERTREVGLLRAVGLSRRQLRRMVRLEAIAIALLGAVLGISAGLLFGAVLQRALVDQGITDLTVPWARIVLFVLIAAIVGVLAAVLPARRAARLNVLQAITGR
jgi:putative ABC transport system permease protein|nr:transporter permease [Aeromicrobium sp.]